MYLCICVAGHAHEISLVVSLEITKKQKINTTEQMIHPDVCMCVYMCV